MTYKFCDKGNAYVCVCVWKEERGRHKNDFCNACTFFFFFCKPIYNLEKQHLNCHICFEEFSAKENILKLSEEELKEIAELSQEKRDKLKEEQKKREIHEEKEKKKLLKEQEKLKKKQKPLMKDWEMQMTLDKNTKEKLEQEQKKNDEDESDDKETKTRKEKRNDQKMKDHWRSINDTIDKEVPTTPNEHATNTKGQTNETNNNADTMLSIPNSTTSSIAEDHAKDEILNLEKQDYELMKDMIVTEEVQQTTPKVNESEKEKETETGDNKNGTVGHDKDSDIKKEQEAETKEEKAMASPKNEIEIITSTEDDASAKSQKDEDKVVRIMHEERPWAEFVNASRLTDDVAIALSRCPTHLYHIGCILQWISDKRQCPVCKKNYGHMVGNQPDGTLSVEKINESCEGYEGCKTHKLTFQFEGGIQGYDHPNPGQPYFGDIRVAYLPDTKEGREVLKLLRTAWERKLIFTVGYSMTRLLDNVIVFNGIHLKTNMYGGFAYHGFPDQGYFERVKDELKSKGIGVKEED
ncbi:BAL-associated protein [Reticulomyxa filosa]|uniref:RING-type E3 ubiquitin transferase n=1 Tax=Reticulomyxa filosa TaxID=46433 RepID=X6MVB4_RETFI|nr:BAL-associated protein [Reticulomyxa filosa]|eukprot:ETO17591.1 BAL-associated protein [Reticulomyxa filosa]